MLRICFWSGYNPCQKLHFQRSKGPSYTLQLATKSQKNRTKMAQTQPQGLTKAFMASQSGCAEVALWSHFCATVTSRRKFQNSLHMQPSDPCHVNRSTVVEGVDGTHQLNRSHWQGWQEGCLVANLRSGLDCLRMRPYRRALIACNTKACRKAGIVLILQFLRGRYMF